MIIENVSYATFKDFITQRVVLPQCLTNSNVRILFATDGPFSVKAKIKEGSADYLDFQSNVEPLCNKTLGNKVTNDPFAAKTLPNGQKVFKRNHGMGQIILNAGELGHFEFQIGYNHAKMEALELIGQLNPIEVDLFIEDDDNGLYSGTGTPRYPLNQFGFDYNVPKDFYRSASKYDADLYFGMWVVAQVNNVSLVPQTIKANIELNEVV